MLIIHVTGCEDVAKIGMTFPEEIIEKIFEYERFLLMKEHLPMFKYVLKDIEEGLKIILTDRDWFKRRVRYIDDVFWLQFPWKRDWSQQPLEGAALYCGEKRIVCSKQVPAKDMSWNGMRHPYYRTKFSDRGDWDKPTRQEAKLINEEYFHR